MRLTSFLFEVIRKTSPMDKSEFAELKEEATKWYDEINPKNPENKGIKAMVKTWGEKWGVRLILALAFPFVVKAFRDMIEGTNTDDDEQD